MQLIDNGAAIVVAGNDEDLVLLQEQIASASATLDFTAFLSSSYDKYVFEFHAVLPATSTADIWMRMGTGAGPTWDTGANYTWAHFQHSQIPSSAVLGSAGDTKIKLAHSLGNGSTNGASGEVKLYDPLSTTVHKRVIVQLTDVDSSGNFVDVIDSAQYVSTTALTGVQFLPSSGNFTSGIIRVYGLVNT